MKENKKIIDLTCLQRYDENIKTYINNAVDAKEILSITDEEIGNLFSANLLNTKYVSQDRIQDAINTEYQK